MIPAHLFSPRRIHSQQYAHWTQRGYYPDDPHKENQDESSVIAPFASSANDAMLAVYDGHGKNGHSCARFVKRSLPQLLAKYVKQARVKKYQAQSSTTAGKRLFDPPKWPLLSPDEYQECCRKSFLECNEALHNSDDVGDMCVECLFFFVDCLSHTRCV